MASVWDLFGEKIFLEGNFYSGPFIISIKDVQITYNNTWDFNLQEMLSWTGFY